MPGEHVEDVRGPCWFPGARSIWFAWQIDPFELGDLVFELCYTLHGGSGLGMQPSEALALEYKFALDLYSRLGERRREEAEAIRPKK